MNEKILPIDLIKLNQPKTWPEITTERKARGKAEYEKKKVELIMQAIYMHTKGVSYRGLRVGVSIIADNPDVEGGYQIESSHNFKPMKLRQNGWDKLCAENNACSAAILDGADYISGIVVASNHKILGNEQEDSTQSKHALHSCRNCRNLYRELIGRGIMSNETMIRFVNDDPLVVYDKDDLEELIGGFDLAPVRIKIPKLKLKKQLKEEDVIDLPYEEMTLGEFLNMGEYRNDPPSKSGITPAPYTLV